MKARTSARTSAGIGLALALGGCYGVEAEERAEDVENIQSSLAASAGATLWDTQGSVVKICWTNTGLWDAKGRIQIAVEAAWGGPSGLTFVWPSATNDPTCPRSDETVANEFMPIFVVDTPSFGGVCNFGVGGRRPKEGCGGVMQCQCVIQTGTSSQYNLEYAAMHEVGHGLGMIHEHKRADRPANIQSTCTDPNPDPNKWTNNDQYTIESPAILPTPYDGASVMNYCYDPDNDGLHGEVRVNVGNQYPEDSLLDKLGIEILYPFGLNRRPVAANGIGNGDGTMYIVRGDVPTKLQIDWVSRGAATAFFSSPRWRDGSTLAQFSTSLSPSLTVVGSKVVEVEVNDGRGRHHSWTGATIIANTTLFTAVASTSNNYLLL